MGKVDCLDLPGLVCWFWSNDHDPPHFHVKREGEWEIRVMFTEGAEEMFEQVWGEVPSSKVLRRIRKAVLSNRENLLAEWEANVNQ